MSRLQLQQGREIFQLRAHTGRIDRRGGVYG
jgi:hypothetical protein